MKTQSSLALLAAFAALITTPFATAATETTRVDTKKIAAPAAQEKVVKLTAKQALPKTVKQVTIIDREPGDKKGKVAETDYSVLMHYTGWLYDSTKPDGKGEKFDSSLTRQIPYGFFIGSGKAIKGWDLGVVGMKTKGKRTLIIPPAFAYRDVARPNIPANSTLIFDVELLEVLSKLEKSTSAPAATDPATAAAAAAAASAAVAAAATPATPVPASPPPTIERLAPQDALPPAPTAITAIDEVVGEGTAAELGNVVKVHYTGWLYDATKPGGKGQQFDTSRERNQLFAFKLGGGRVIKGWDFGVVGMKVKGKRTLIIPAEFGYGARGAGQGLIPPNAALIFDVEMVEIPAPPAPPAPAAPAAAPAPAAPATK